MARSRKESQDRSKKDSESIIYCSFCGKSQYEVRRLIAGPAVFVCDECTDICASIIVQESKPEELENLFPALYGIFRTDEKNPSKIKDQILRSIEFAPEHRQAGIGILNYFSKYLTERYPDISVRVVIEQEAGKVRMIVESDNGPIDTVEQTLEEYALIVTGRAAPEDFLSNQYQVMELKQKLEMAAMEIRWQNKFITSLEHDKISQRDFFMNQIEQLNRSLSAGMANSSRLIQALEEVIRRPAIDPSIQSAIERIVTNLREQQIPDETQTREELNIIARKDPHILRDLYELCANTATGAAGNLLASWISPLLYLLPR
jgi:hypothetical protein